MIALGKAQEYSIKKYLNGLCRITLTCIEYGVSGACSSQFHLCVYHQGEMGRMAYPPKLLTSHTSSDTSHGFLAILAQLLHHGSIKSSFQVSNRIEAGLDRLPDLLLKLTRRLFLVFPLAQRLRGLSCTKRRLEQPCLAHLGRSAHSYSFNMAKAQISRPRCARITSRIHLITPLED